MRMHLGAPPGHQQLAQLGDRAVEKRGGEAAGLADLVEHRMHRIAGGALCIGKLAVPDHAGQPVLHGAGLGDDLLQALVVDVDLAGFVSCTSCTSAGRAGRRGRASVAECGVEPNQRHRRPGQAVVALVAPRAAGLGKVVLAAVVEDGGAGIELGAVEHLAERKFSRLVARDDAPARVDEDERHAALRVLQIAEEQRQLRAQVEAQHDGATRHTLRRDDAVRVDEHVTRVGEEIARAVALDPAALGHRIRPPSRWRKARIVARHQAQQRAGLVVQQDDVVVDAVLRAVLDQAGRQPCAQHIGIARLRRTNECNERAIGRDEAHIGGALEEVAGEDVDRHLRLRGEITLPIGEVRGGNALDQFGGQCTERRAGAAQHGEKAGLLIGADDARRGFDHFPAQVDALQLVLEALQAAHLRGDDVVVSGHAGSNQVASWPGRRRWGRDDEQDARRGPARADFHALY